MSTINYPDGSTDANALVLTDNSTQLQETSGTATQSGVISESGGSFGVEKTGAGTLILTAANTYSGTTTITGGTLQIGNGGTSGNVLGNIVDNSLLVFDRTTTLNLIDETYAGVISGTGALTTNSGLTVLTGANTYTGGTTIAGGGISLQDGGSVVGNIVDNGVLQLNEPNGYILSNDISGTGYLSAINTTGTVILTGNDTYTGGTSVSPGGSLQIGNGGTSGSIVGDINIGNTGTVIFDRSDDITFAGSISLNGNIVKLGAGALVLSGAVFSGNATVTAGTLQFGAGSAAVSSGSGPNVYMAGISDSGTAIVDYSNTFNIRGVISGTGGLSQIGSGTLLLTGANTYSGGTTISGGTLQIDNGGTSGSLGSGAVTDNANLVFDRSDNITVSNAISGTGTLTQAGSGVLTLTGASTYTGGTTVSSGTLRLGSSGTNLLATSGALTINGGTFDLAGRDQTVGALSGTGGTITTGGGYLTTVSNGNSTFAGAITGAGGLNKGGTGTLTLTGANTYAGGTDISAGTLKLGASNSLAANSALAIGDTGTLDLNNNDLTVSSFTGSSFGSILLGSATLSVVSNTAEAYIDGVISGTGGMIKGGSGLLTVEQNQTYSGRTTINGGQLTIGSGLTTGAVAGDITDNASLAFNRTDSVTYSGSIDGTGSVAQIGTGTLYLTGNNTYAGITLISEGTLSIASASNIGAGDIQMYTNFSVLRFNASLSMAQNIQFQQGTLSTDANTNVTLSGILSTMAGTSPGTGRFSKVGAGTLTLTGNNTYQGPTVISAGTLQVGNAGTSGSLGSGAVTDNSALVFNRSDTITVANTISGTGSVTFTNFGGVTLTGNNSYSGGTTIYEGALLVGNGGTTGSITGDVVAGVATSNSGINFDRSDSITFSGNISGLGYVTQNGTGTLTLTGNNSYGANTTISQGKLAIASASNLGAGAINLFSAGTLRLNGSFALTQNVSLGGGAFDTGSNNDTLSGVLSDNIVQGGFTKLGAGTLTLTGTNTYSSIAVISAGTLQVGNGGTTGSLGAGSVTDNSALVLDRSDNITDPNLISGSGSLTQAGSGVLTLAHADTYTGTTTISSGTLALSGSGGIAASGGVADNGAFDISQTSSGASITTLVGSGAVALGGRTLTITAGTGLIATSVLSGVIADGGIGGGTGGSLVISGGTEGLTGNNTYTGTTTIAAGATLVIGVNTATGSLGGGAVTDNGILGYGRTAATTLANVISGTGELDQVGSGVLTLTAAEAYTGRTAINTATTLALSGAGSIAASSYLGDAGGTFDISGTTSGASIKALSDLGSAGATIALGGKTLTIAAGANYIFSGVIQDGGIAGGTGGGLTIAGGGQDLSGNNTYTGTTTIASGANLVIGNNTATGSLGSGAVSDNGTLVYDLTSTATVANVISGSGAFIQFGSGHTVLGGLDTYTGATSVTAGILSVDGSIASSAVTVSSGATLGGAGTVGATSIQSGATLAPGDGVGTLQVNGNLTLASGATDAEEISPSAADEILVSGSAGIAGTLAENFAGGSYGHQTYTILHSTGALSGTFANVSVTGLPAGLTATLSYDANDVYLTTDNAPVVTTSNLTKPHGQTLAASSLFTASDPDGDAITKYQFWDATSDPNSGHFVVNDVAQAAQTVIEVTAALLSQVSFVTGSVADNLQVRAFDGTDWSAADNAQWAPFTVSIAADRAPVVTTANLTEAAGQTLAASSLFSVSDPDGDTITEYQFWDATPDANSGHFVVNGVAQAARTVIDIPASQLGQVSFVTGSVADNLQVRASDGTVWSAADNAQWAPFTISVPVVHPPVVTTSNISAQRGQPLAASSLFTVSDPDGNAITEYQFWDATTDPNSGHFVVNGVAQAARTVIDIPASQLGQVSFVTGTSVADNLQVRAFDGISWSAADNAQWAPFTVSLPADRAPVVTTSNLTKAAGQTLSASSLFSASDPDGDAITEYQFWDATSDPNSGHFVVNGVAQAAQTVIDISASQLSQVSFVTGSVADNLQVRASDGTLWSAADDAQWAPFTISVPVVHPPVVTTSNISAQRGQTLTASSLFSASDPDGNTITEYQFWDATPDINSGYFTVGGVVQAARTVIDISASQLSQVNFVTGTSVADNLQVRAFDGISWSAADNARWAPFTVSVPADNPPVVTTGNLTKAAGQTLSASSLFTASDPDGDAITEYQFWDATPDANSGYFTVGGVVQAARTVIDVSAAQLSQVSFVTGSVADNLQVRASDGTLWSAADNAQWAPFTISVPVNHPPVVTTSDISASANQSLAASSLFSVSDPDGDTVTEYQFWDATPDATSGHFVVSGAAQAARTVIDIPASQLSQVSFLTGSTGDALQVRAFDGKSWSAADNAQWAPFHVAVG